MSGISTHILDQVNGIPAKGVSVSLWFEGDLITETITDSDGRCSALVGEEEMKTGKYQLVFRVGAYFVEKSDTPTEAFFDEVPVAFTVSDLSRHYHVPLLVSPYGYSTYRGS